MDPNRRAEQAIRELLSQLKISDEYAKQENPGSVPSVWQLQNSLVRSYANEAVAALNALHERVTEIAGDFHPDTDRDAPLALQEMRDAISALLS